MDKNKYFAINNDDSRTFDSKWFYKILNKIITIHNS